MTANTAMAQWMSAFVLAVLATSRPAFAQATESQTFESGTSAPDVWYTDNPLTTIVSCDDSTPDSPSQTMARVNETLVPLPPAGWTGLVGLLGMGIFRGRKAIRRLLS